MARIGRIGKGAHGRPHLSAGGGGSPVPSGTHPRLYITPTTVTDFQTKLGVDFNTEYQANVDYAISYLASTPTTFTAGQTPLPGDYQAVNFAFIYAVGSVPGINYAGHSIAEFGQRAVDLVEIWRTSGQPQWYHTLPGMQVVYDWCYPLLNTAQKTALVTAMNALQDHQHYGPTDHFQGLYANAGVLSGLANTGDGYDDANAALRAARFNTDFHNTDTGQLDAYSYMAGSAGGFSEGLTYSTVEQSGMIPLFMAAEGWRTANNLTRSETLGQSWCNVLRYYPQWIAYRIRPFAKIASYAGGREYILWSDAHNQQSPNRVDKAFNGAVGLIQVLKSCTIYSGVDNDMAGLARWLLTNRVGEYPASSVYTWDHGTQMWADFIFGSKTATAMSPSALNLPLSKAFLPMGHIIMRTGWTAIDDTMVVYVGLKWNLGANGYTDTANGTFTIDRNGPLIIHAGCGGHHSYSSMSFSQNIPVFVDDAAVPAGAAIGSGLAGYSAYANTWDFGAQRVTQLCGDLTALSELVSGGKHDFGGVARYRLYDAANADVDYAYSDMTNAYASTGGYNDGVNTRKVDSVTRSFVYFRKQSSSATDQVMVLDRSTTTHIKFKKRPRFHVGVAPTCNGSASTVRQGVTDYAGATLLTISNTSSGSDGKCWVTPLVPASVTIRVVGGPNGSGNFTTENSGADNGGGQTVVDAHEFEDPYGLNWFNQLQTPYSDYDTNTGRQFFGWGHFSIQPTVDSLYDNMLTVFEVGDNADTPSTTEKWAGTNFIAGRCGNRVAVFADTETTRTSGTLVLPTAGTYKILWCDLTAGSRTFTPGANITSVTKVEDASSSPFTVSSANNTVYLTVVVGTSGSGAANTITLS